MVNIIVKNLLPTYDEDYEFYDFETPKCEDIGFRKVDIKAMTYLIHYHFDFDGCFMNVKPDLTEFIESVKMYVEGLEVLRV